MAIRFWTAFLCCAARSRQRLYSSTSGAVAGYFGSPQHHTHSVCDSFHQFVHSFVITEIVVVIASHKNIYVCRQSFVRSNLLIRLLCRHFSHFDSPVSSTFTRTRCWHLSSAVSLSAVFRVLFFFVSSYTCHDLTFVFAGFSPKVDSAVKNM